MNDQENHSEWHSMLRMEVEKIDNFSGCSIWPKIKVWLIDWGKKNELMKKIIKKGFLQFFLLLEVIIIYNKNGDDSTKVY
jgi:hypothetical protein